MPHRPGPWNIVSIDTKSENDATWLDNQHVAVIDDGKGWEFAWTDGISLEEVTANARLIAAAPDLLAACEAAYLRMLQLPGSSQFRFESQRELSLLRDALAAAGGQSDEEVQTAFEAKAGPGVEFVASQSTIRAINLIQRSNETVGQTVNRILETLLPSAESFDHFYGPPRDGRGPSGE